MSSRTDMHYWLVASSFIIGVLSVVQFMNVPTYHFGEADLSKEDVKDGDEKLEAAFIISIITAVIAWVNFATEAIQLASFKYPSMLTAVHYFLLLVLSATTTGLSADHFQDAQSINLGPVQAEIPAITMGPAFIVSDVSVLAISCIGLYLAVKKINEE